MSDPVTNVDVEDVLSSIRRLVSDTNSAQREVSPEDVQREASADPAPEQAKPAEALILTSALRVNSPQPEDAAEPAHADMANFRHHVSGETAEPEGDDHADAASEHADWSGLSDEDYYEDDEAAESAPVIDFIRHSRSTDPEPTAEVEAAWAADLSEFTEAPDEGAQDSDHVEDSPAEDTDTEESHTDDAYADGDHADGDHTDGGDVEDAAEVWTDFHHHDADEGEEREAAADHAADATPHEAPQIDPDADDAEELTEDTHTEEGADALAEEAVFASAAAASVMDTPEEGEAAEIDLGDFDESVIDEDTLRDLVAEIVRQELTGELGERITRNVRKLVRREIHRAMLTREFD